MLYSSLYVGDVRADYLRFLNGKNLFFHFKYVALGEVCSLTTTYPRVYMLLLFVLLERFLLLMCLCCVLLPCEWRWSVEARRGSLNYCSLSETLLSLSFKLLKVITSFVSSPKGIHYSSLSFAPWLYHRAAPEISRHLKKKFKYCK